MTPELQKELIVDIVSVSLTALFAGIPAILLFWWTWQRDQERLLVQKLIPFAKTIEGKRVQLRDASGPTLGIFIRNRSLFPVHVSAAGFNIDGEIIQLDNPYFPTPMKKNPDERSSRPYIPDDTVDPHTIESQGSTSVSVLEPTDREKLSAALWTAAEKHDTSVDNLLLSRRVMVLVVLESGRTFTSLPFHKRVWRRVLELKQEYI